MNKKKKIQGITF